MFSNSPAQIVSAFIVFVLGFFMIWGVCKYFKTTIKRASFLYIWHTIFCLLYTAYVLKNGGDAKGYYISAFMLGEQNEFGVGTKGINYLTALLVQIFNLSFIGCSLVFNILGSLGLLAFDAILRQTVQFKSLQIKRLSTLIVFLPSVSFWSAGLGKDAISFMATGFALWAAVNFKKHIVLFIFAILLMLFVRPHIAGIMVASFALAFIFDRKASLVQRFSVGSIAIIATGIAIPFALQYAGLGSAQSTSDLQSYIETRQGANLEGGGSVDIKSMSLPMQMFTYLFRPLPFEANSIFAFAASLDNIILIYLFIIGIRAILKRKRPSMTSNRAFLWLYAIITLIILSMTTANLGIAIRQKWMFAPMFIFLLISVIGINKMPSKQNIENAK